MRVIMPAIINQAGQKFNVDKLDGVSRRHNLPPGVDRQPRNLQEPSGRPSPIFRPLATSEAVECPDTVRSKEQTQYLVFEPANEMRRSSTTRPASAGVPPLSQALRERTNLFQRIQSPAILTRTAGYLSTAPLQIALRL